MIIHVDFENRRRLDVICSTCGNALVPGVDGRGDAVHWCNECQRLAGENDALAELLELLEIDKHA